MPYPEFANGKSAFFYLGREAEWLEVYPDDDEAAAEYICFAPDFTVDVVQDELG